MSEYSCANADCRRASRVFCYCCAKNYCIEHLKDHNDGYLSQLYQLTNDVNLVSENLRGRYRQQLDQWRHQAHRTIDLYYEKKCQELESQLTPDENFNQNQQVIQWIQSKISQLIREQDINQKQIDSLRAATNAVRRELEQISRESYQWNIPPLILDENFIQLEKTKVDFDLYATSKSVILRENLLTDDCIVMANNSKYLLVSKQTCLCLFDQNLSRIKQIPWLHGCIWDMCMSMALSKFILVADDGVFTFDAQTMVIESATTLTKSKTSWYCCASTEKSLFFATQEYKTMISEYVFREHGYSLERNQVCCSGNEYVEHMKCSKDALALIIINDLTSERRFDLRSTRTFYQLWTISLNIPDKLNIVSCCSLNEKGWLIVDLAQTRLVHITNQGQMKENITYQPAPQYAVQFNENILAILAEDSINLHKIR